MTCKDARKRMGAHVLRELPDDTARRLDAHLAACEACRAAFDRRCRAVELLEQSLAASEPEPSVLSPSAREAVRYSARSPGDARRAWLAQSWRWIPAAAAALLMAGFVWFAVSGLQGPPPAAHEMQASAERGPRMDRAPAPPTPEADAASLRLGLDGNRSEPQHEQEQNADRVAGAALEDQTAAKAQVRLTPATAQPSEPGEGKDRTVEAEAFQPRAEVAGGRAAALAAPASVSARGVQSPEPELSMRLVEDPFEDGRYLAVTYHEQDGYQVRPFVPDTDRAERRKTAGPAVQTDGAGALSEAGAGSADPTGGQAISFEAAAPRIRLAVIRARIAKLEQSDAAPDPNLVRKLAGYLQPLIRDPAFHQQAGALAERLQAVK